MSSSRPITRAYGRYALGLLTVINIVNYVERNAIFALFEPIKRDLGLSDTHLGWLASAYVLVFSLAALPVGVLSDLSSRTTVTSWSVSLWSAFTSLGGLARNFFQLMISRAAVGFGGAGANAASTALVADYFPGTTRAAAMSIFTAGLALGGVMGLLIAGQLESQYGWRVAFMALGFPGFGLAFLVSRLRDPMRTKPLRSVWEQVRHLGLETRSILFAGMPLLTGLAVGAGAAFILDQFYGADSAADTAVFAICAGAGLAFNIRSWVHRAAAVAQHRVGSRVSDGVHSAFAELVSGFETVLRTPTLVYVFIGGALISFGMNGIVGWAPAFMTRELGLSVAEATLLLGKAGLIVGIVGTLTGGLLADWIQKRYAWGRVLISAVGFLIGAPLIVWLLTIRDLTLFTWVFSAAFFFTTWYNGPLTSVIFDVVPQRISTTVVGAYLLFIHLAGDAIAFPLVGMLSDRFGIATAVMVLPIAAAIGGAVVLGSVRTVGADMDRVAT